MDIEKMMIDFSEYLKGESVQNESDAEKYLLKFMEERNIDPAEVLSSMADADTTIGGDCTITLSYCLILLLLKAKAHIVIAKANIANTLFTGFLDTVAYVQ